MTEAEWLTATDPDPMFRFVHARLNDRQRRLLACACCRDWVQGCRDDRVTGAIAAAEQWADGADDLGARFRAWDDIWLAHDEAFKAKDIDAAIRLLYVSTCLSESDPLHLFVERAPAFWQRVRALPRRLIDRLPLGIATARPPARPQTWCPIIRDVCGNPFRPVAYDSSWRTSTAVALASQMYESRDFGAMPILADALQDAGCDSEDVLNHCRGPGPHARGCWVVDLVLGKE